MKVSTRTFCRATELYQREASVLFDALKRSIYEHNSCVFGNDDYSDSVQEAALERRRTADQAVFEAAQKLDEKMKNASFGGGSIFNSPIKYEEATDLVGELRALYTIALSLDNQGWLN